MVKNFQGEAMLFKALSDEKRLQIAFEFGRLPAAAVAVDHRGRSGHIVRSAQQAAQKAKTKRPGGLL